MTSCTVSNPGTCSMNDPSAGQATLVIPKTQTTGSFGWNLTACSGASVDSPYVVTTVRISGDAAVFSLDSGNIEVTESTDTCTCPGDGNNWEIDMTDACNIVDNCHLGTGQITFINTGTTIFNAQINCSNLEHPTTDQILDIGANAFIIIG